MNSSNQREPTVAAVKLDANEIVRPVYRCGSRRVKSAWYTINTCILQYTRREFYNTITSINLRIIAQQYSERRTSRKFAQVSHTIQKNSYNTEKLIQYRDTADTV